MKTALPFRKIIIIIIIIIIITAIIIITINKYNNFIQLLTVVPELATLDCSLKHVLQVPNTHPYHS